MPFDLKNASATYQRLVNNMFKYQISQNIEVYVDDMLIKSKTLCCHVDDLKDLCHTSKISDEIESDKVHLWHNLRKNFGILGVKSGCRGQLGEDQSHPGHGSFENHKKGLKYHGMDGSTQPIRIQIN